MLVGSFARALFLVHSEVSVAEFAMLFSQTNRDLWSWSSGVTGRREIAAASCEHRYMLHRPDKKE